MRMLWIPILHILPGLMLKPALKGSNAIGVCYYFRSVGFSPLDKYAAIGVPGSLFVNPP
jgi:hypothetical protein